MMELRRGMMTRELTLGSITVDGEHICRTLEKPWLDNIPFQSCIPAGLYTLEPHESEKYGQTFALVNKSLKVGHYRGDSKRFACLFHPANWAYQLSGCIAPGVDRMRDDDGVYGITSSRQAFRDLLEIIEKNGINQVFISQ